MAWSIAPFDVADAVEVGRVHVQVWREAYAGLMPAAFLDGLDPEARAATWRAWGTDPADPTITLVAHDDDGITGFATGGPARDADPPARWQLYAINLLVRAHGSGVADALVEATVGERDAYLWVFEGNDRAAAFYRRHGFAADGAHDLHESTGTRELRMTRLARRP